MVLDFPRRSEFTIFKMEADMRRYLSVFSPEFEKGVGSQDRCHSFFRRRTAVEVVPFAQDAPERSERDDALIEQSRGKPVGKSFNPLALPELIGGKLDHDSEVVSPHPCWISIEHEDQIEIGAQRQALPRHVFFRDG